MPELTRLAQVLDNARILREFKNDDRVPFRALRSGLRRHGDGGRRRRARKGAHGGDRAGCGARRRAGGARVRPATARTHAVAGRMPRNPRDVGRPAGGGGLAGLTHGAPTSSLITANGRRQAEKRGHKSVITDGPRRARHGAPTSSLITTKSSTTRRAAPRFGRDHRDTARMDADTPTTRPSVVITVGVAVPR